jgi:hypothetical protein
MDSRDELASLWTGTYDVSEELVASEDEDSPLSPLVEQLRVQVAIRRIQLPWLGTHVLYVEESPYDEPFELRRRVLLSIDPAAEADGALRVRQYTRKRATWSRWRVAIFTSVAKAGSFAAARAGATVSNRAPAASAGSTTAWSSATGSSGIANARSRWRTTS